MKLNSLFSLILILTCTALHAQIDNRVIIDRDISLLNDTNQNELFIRSLNEFLTLAQHENEQNHLVHPDQTLETYLLLDEIFGIENSTKYEDEFYYKPYLTNVLFLGDTQHLVQVSYIGVDNNTPILRASFEFIAHYSSGGFLFSSPLVKNTSNWKTAKIGSTTFHFESLINKRNMKKYHKLSSQFDSKLNSPCTASEFYCCNDLYSLLNLIGVSYKMDYNGLKQGVTSSSSINRKITVLGNRNATFDNFDPHDLWHDRLSMVVPRSSVYHSIDEGCAYLYGGSWGISWDDILDRFMKEVATDSSSDWTAYNETSHNFGENQEKRLMVHYLVNALIVQHLEKEQGFASVWEFLNCGTSQQGTDNYYNSLEKLTGFSKSEYNDWVWTLIRSEM